MLNAEPVRDDITAVFNDRLLANIGRKEGKESGATAQKGQQRDKAGKMENTQKKKKRVKNLMDKMLWPLHAVPAISLWPIPIPNPNAK